MPNFRLLSLLEGDAQRASNFGKNCNFLPFGKVAVWLKSVSMRDMTMKLCYLASAHSKLSFVYQHYYVRTDTRTTYTCIYKLSCLEININLKISRVIGRGEESLAVNLDRGWTFRYSILRTTLNNVLMLPAIFFLLKQKSANLISVDIKIGLFSFNFRKLLVI